ncbi:hypothetical protein [Pseudarthrobacter phenanthrenivorans]|uniref:hypothetical protein n=1 Tax=Pseudarthrobacter phenanthrenivorans TaxID=361575 RepID=UPI002F35B8B3
MTNIRMSGGYFSVQGNIPAPARGLPRRRDRRADPLGTVLRRVAAIVAYSALLLLRDTVSLEVLVLCTLLVPLAQAVLFRKVRLSSLLLFSLTLYASTAWLAMKYGRQNFDPWPQLDVVQKVTLMDVTCVLLAGLATEILIGSEAIDRAVRRSAKAVQDAFSNLSSPVPDALLSFAMLGIGMLDSYKILTIGLGTVLSGERREYAKDLLLASNHNVQVFGIAASVFLIIRVVLVRTGMLPVVALTAAWLPFLLVGSRKEAITVAAISVVILATKINVRGAVVLSLGFLGSLGLPALKTGNWYASLHEFILPQYMHFAIGMGLVPPGLGGSFIERAQFLLPSFLRLSRITDIGREFFALHITGVGVGASPFAEAELNNFFGSPYLSFVLLYVLLAAIMVLASKRLPLMTCIFYGLMLVYGRSDFWTMAFFGVYVSLLVKIFVDFSTALPSNFKTPAPRAHPV